jgi:putative ABC transport system substrate-binding protein
LKLTPATADAVELAARVVDEPVALLASDAGVAAKLFNLADRRRGPLNDCMIAATALRMDASIATTNRLPSALTGPILLRVDHPRCGIHASSELFGRAAHMPEYTRRSRRSLIVWFAFIGFVAAVMLAAPFLVAAQPPQKLFRVAHLSVGGRTPDGAPPRPLREALRGLGYIEGQNVAYESRFAEGKVERLPALAAELVRLKVDVIVAQGGPATQAAKQATSTIPIVMAPAAADAVATGLIASLARPGANVTGLTDQSVQLSAKRMELLKEAVPKAAVIAVLWNESDDGMTLRYRAIEKAARILNVEVQALGLRQPDDFDVAFSTMTRRRPDAMFLVADALTMMNRKRLVEFAATQRIPAMYEYNVIVSEGGLMSYGPSFEDSFRQAALYIDRIFRGAKPGDLPAEQPMKYYLTVNRKTAATLGLTLPASVLVRADQVIE